MKNNNTLNLINFFTRHKDLSRAQKARFNALVARDLNEQVNDKSILQRKVGHGSHAQALHIPKEVTSFLTLFTTQDTALRYITHLWDTNQFESYQIFEEQDIKDIKSHEIWKSNSDTNHSSRLYLASTHLYYLIFNFLLEDKYKKWHDKYDICFGLKNISQYIADWMNKNPGSQPSEMPLKFIPKDLIPQKVINDMPLLVYEDVLSIFRKSICYKGAELYHTFRRIFNRGEFSINQESIKTLRGLSFYTDTQKIEDAIRKIAKNCLDYKQFSEITIRGEVKEASLIITILQSGSFANCKYNTDKLQLRNKGDMIDIKRNLQSLCDFSIKSRFIDDNGNSKTAVISYLYDVDFDAPPKVEWFHEDCHGFEYILKFYLV